MWDENSLLYRRDVNTILFTTMCGSGSQTQNPTKRSQGLVVHPGLNDHDLRGNVTRGQSASD